MISRPNKLVCITLGVDGSAYAVGDKACKVPTWRNDEYSRTYDFEKEKRFEESVDMDYSVVLTIKKNDPVLEVEYDFVNAACDPRLRFGIESDFTANCVTTDSPFDSTEHTRGEQS